MKLPSLLENSLPFLGHLSRFKREPLDFWLRAGEQEPVVRVRLGPREIWVVTDADWFQHIFQRNVKNYPRQSRLQINKYSAENAHSVFTAPTWDEWLWRRRLLQPAFHRKKIAQFADTMVGETVRLIDEWETGKQFDLRTIMKTLTMRIIGQTMFSADMQQTTTLQHAFETVSEFSYRNAAAIIPTPLWLPTPFNRRVQNAFATREKMVGKIVDERTRQTTIEHSDLLDMLIAAELEDGGQKFDSADLLQEMLSIVFAGHETTALTLTWLFYELSQRSHIKERLLTELKTVLKKRLPTIADLPHLTYTDQVIQEVLRCYPPIFLTLREATAADRCGNFDIPAGTEFALNIRGLHRSPRYWKEPNRFDPDRFAPGNGDNRHKFAFQPFISGPKKCIGDSFAMMEMQLVVATMLQKTQIRAHTTTPPKPVAGFVMEPGDPIPVSIHPLL